MIEANIKKDIREILKEHGPEILRQTFSDLEVITPASESEPFEWILTDGAEVWTNNLATISQMSDKPIWDGLLREREVATIIGAAKTYKTWFALALALAISKGQTFIGRETQQRKTLYLDYELKPGTFRKRMCQLSYQQPSDFFYQCLRGSSRLPQVNEISELVEREGFGLVVIDSLYRTGWLSEENNNDTTSRELTALQTFTDRVNCTIVVVDHTAKGGGKDRSVVDTGRGASTKGGFYDTLWVLRPGPKGLNPNDKYVILDTEMRDWPSAVEQPLIMFSWSHSNCTLELAGAVGANETDLNATKILEFLKKQGKAVAFQAIARATGIPETTLRKCIGTLSAQIEGLPDPVHNQRKLYKLRDMIDANQSSSGARGGAVCAASSGVI
jgi:biotin operon repressor